MRLRGMEFVSPDMWWIVGIAPLRGIRSSFRRRRRSTLRRRCHRGGLSKIEIGNWEDLRTVLGGMNAEAAVTTHKPKREEIEIHADSGRYRRDVHRLRVCARWAAGNCESAVAARDAGRGDCVGGARGAEAADADERVQ